MGLSGIGFWEITVILLVAVLIFGTGKLRSIGGDLGAALRNFRNAAREPREPAQEPPPAEGEKPGGPPGDSPAGKPGT
jgi:sec-independent protein translocase protein TatA